MWKKGDTDRKRDKGREIHRFTEKIFNSPRIKKTAIVSKF